MGNAVAGIRPEDFMVSKMNFVSKFADLCTRSNETRVFKIPFFINIDEVPAQFKVELTL
jgi:hypothetical protein